MRLKLFFALIWLLGAGKLCADNEKALKYLKLCIKKPSSKYLFNHLYDAWSDDDISLEQELKKRITKGANAAYERLLVRLLEKEGRDAEALELSKKLLLKNHDDPNLLLCKARLEFNEHDYEKCIEDLKRVLKNNKLPEKMKLEVNKMLGRSWLRIDKEKEALAVWEKIYADNPEFELGEDILQLLLNEGLYEDANKFCLKLLKDTKDKFRQLKLNIKNAEILRLKGSRKKALAAYREILTQTGSGSWLEKEIYSRIVRIYQNAADSDGLLKFTFEFINENSTRSAIRLRYIDLLYTGGKKDEALKAYQELIKKAPLNKDYRIGYAKMLVRCGKYKQAAAVYGQLAKQFPKNSELLFSKAAVEARAGNKKVVLADIKAFLALNPTGEYPYIRAAKLLEKSKMDKEAGEFYQKFMSKFPESSDALEAYALWLIRTEKTEEAVKLLCAGKSMPLPVLLRRVKLLLSCKKNEQAYALLKRFEKSYKKDFCFNESLFMCADALKKQNECMQLISQLVNSAMGWEELRRAISSVSYMLDKNKIREKYIEQLDALNKAGKLKANILCLAAVLQERQNGEERALAILNDAIKKYPGNPMLYRQKAILLNGAGNYREAAKVLQELLRHERKFRALIYKKLVVMYQKEDDKKEALKWAAKLKREFPDSVRSWIVYARAQQLAGKNDEAIKTLGRAAYRFSDNNELREQLVRSYFVKGDMRGAINICWKILRNSKKIDSKIEVINRIYRLSNSENLKDVLKSRLKLQMKNNPNDPFPLLALAEVAKLSYQYNEYRDYIQKASQLSKNSTYLQFKLAEIDEEQGNYASAERILKQLCKKDQSDKVRMKLAEFYFRSGEDEKGMEIYNSYLRGLKNISTLMSFASKMIVRKQPQEAIKILKEKAALSEDCELHYLLGCAYEDAGKPKLAVREFKRVIALSSKLGSSKKKTTSLSTIYSYNPWGIKFPPAINMLGSIQQMAWQTYRYQQSSYGRYSSLGSLGGNTLRVPTTEDEAKAMVICHFCRLNEKLSASEQKQLIIFMKAAGIKYPDVALIVGNRNGYQANVDVKKLLKKYADNLDMKFYICMRFNQHLQRQLGRKKMTDMMVELCKKRPQYSNMLIYFVLYQGGGKNSKLIDMILDNISKKSRLSFNEIQMLTWGIRNTRIKLKDEQKKLLEKIIIDGLKKLRVEKKQIPVHLPSNVIISLLKNNSIAGAKELLTEELKESGKNKNINIQNYPMTYYHGSGQGLIFNEKPFPQGTLNKLPAVINMIIMQRYGNDVNVQKNFYKACAGIKDLQIKLIVADGQKERKAAAEAAAAIATTPKSSLGSLALAAAWYDKDKQHEKACEILLKARRLLKSKKERRELNCLLIAYALKLEDGNKEKIKKYVGDAAEKLLRLNLNTSEKVSLAKVMQLAGLDKQAAKLEEALLKKQRVAGGSSTRIHGNISLDVYRRIEQMLKKNNKEAAINLAQREYRRLFRVIYGVFSGGQFHNYHNVYQISRLVNTLKNSGVKEDFLAKLNVTSESPLVKQCEYAFACEQFGDLEKAEKVYKRIAKKYPKNRFATFSYGLMLIKNKYSATDPVLKDLQLEDLIIVANNIYNFFKKPEAVLNFYDLLIVKMKAQKDFRSQSFANRIYLFYSLLNYFEGGRYFNAPSMQVPDVFASIKQSKTLKTSVKKYVVRRQKLYLELCDQMMRIPAMAEMAFCRKLKVYQLLKKNTDKFFDEGIKVVKLVNSNPINSYFHNSGQYNLPDFDVWMFITALKTKRLSELFDTLKSCKDSDEIAEQLKSLNTLVKCPAAEFASKAEAFIEKESDINKRADFQKMVIAVHEYRKLDCDLTDLMFKEMKNSDNTMVHNPKISAGIQVWLASLAKRKKVKMLCDALEKITGYYADKYKKEFPNELNVRNRFHQVFSYPVINALRTVFSKILNESPENWYQFYKAMQPLIGIKMFAQQMNLFHNFYRLTEKYPVELLENSTFLEGLKTIDFCKIPQYGDRVSSVYRVLLERYWYNSDVKKKIKKYLKGIKTPSVGVGIFKAAMNKKPEEVFEILGKPENGFEQLTTARKKEILMQIKTVFDSHLIDRMHLKANTPAWKIYQLYKTESKGDFQDRIKKFYKKDINHDRWGYMRAAANLIIDVGAVDVKKAMKIYDSMKRKVELEAIKNTYSSNRHAYENFFNDINNRCRNLKQCRVYYECLKKTHNPSINMISRFYSQQANVLRQHYNKLKNKKDIVKNSSLLLEEYEKAFADSDFVVPYGGLNVLNRLNAKQFEQLIKERNPVMKSEAGTQKKVPADKPVVSKKKSEISKQLDILLQAKLKYKRKQKVSKEIISEIWSRIKPLKAPWKVTLGLKFIRNKEGGEFVLELVDPAIKLALTDKRQIENREIQKIVEKMVTLENNTEFKNAARKIIRYYALEMCKWKEHDFKNNRSLTSYIMQLAYKSGDLKLYNKIIEDFRFAEFANSYIIMVNIGDAESCQKYLHKNYLKFTNVPSVKITPDGKKLAAKICEGIKDEQEKYIARVLFATPYVFVKKNGKSNHQTKTLVELAKDFTKVKFSDKNIKLFCLKALMINNKARTVLAQNGKAIITGIDIKTIIADSQFRYNSQRMFGKLLFESIKYGCEKEVTSLINTLNGIVKGSDNRMRGKARNALYRIGNIFAQVNLRNMTSKEAKTFCKPLLELMENSHTNRNCAAAAAFLNYLVGNEKAFLDITKKVTLDGNYNYYHKLIQIFDRFKYYSRKNKTSTAEAEKMVFNFLDSDSAKVLFRENKDKLEKLKKYMRKRFEKKRKQTKLNNKTNAKKKVK